MDKILAARQAIKKGEEQMAAAKAAAAKVREGMPRGAARTPEQMQAIEDSMDEINAAYNAVAQGYADYRAAERELFGE